MPRPRTFLTLYDNLKTITISFLSKHGYLKPNRCQSGTITWSRDGYTTGSISILVNTQSESPYLELSYKYNETLINYRVQLVSFPSNLGKGIVWYFLCPRTGKRCRKLYSAGAYFYHRSALRGCVYEKQTHSRKLRLLYKTMGACFQKEQLYDALYKKHLKKQYAGKPTKKYRRIMEQLHKAESVPAHAIERALLS